MLFLISMRPLPLSMAKKISFFYLLLEENDVGQQARKIEKEEVQERIARSLFLLQYSPK